MATTKTAVLMAALLAPSWAARAATLQVQGPITVDVREDGKSTTYSAVLTATAGGPIARVDFEASPLLGRGKAAGAVIPAANVTVGALSFTASGTRAVPITIASVPRPGSYGGTLTVKGGDATISVEVELVLHPQVAVKPAAESQAFTLLHCMNAATCRVGELLTPRALGGEERRLGLDSSTAEVLHVDHVTANLDGDRSQTSLTVGAPGEEGEPGGRANAPAPPAGGLAPAADAPQVRLAVPSVLVAQGRSYATLSVERGTVPPDRYRGVLRVFLRESDDPVLVPFTLDVRDGPILAVLLVFAGIVVGRKVQARSSPAAQLRDAAMQSYHLLMSRTGALRDERARNALGTRLEELRRLIVAAPPPADHQEQLQRMQTAIGDELSLLETVEALAARLSADPGGLVRKAIDAILADNPAAGAAVDALRDAVTAPPPAPPRMELVALAPTRPQGWKQQGAVLLGKASGTAWDRAERDYRWYRPVLGGLLLVLLGLIGYQTLYLNGSSTVGSGGLLDYLPLFVWGLSADVAQRTLQNLPAKGS